MVKPLGLILEPCKMDEIEIEIIRNELDKFLTRYNSLSGFNNLSGLMFGCVRIYLKHKEGIREEEFADLLKELKEESESKKIKKYDGLEFVLKLFNNGNLASFVRNNKYSIDWYDNFRPKGKNSEDVIQYTFINK